MEVAKDGKLFFLDVLVSHREDGSLRHTVSHKPIHSHSNRYLKVLTHNHPKQNNSVLRTLIQISISISELSTLESKLQFLTQTVVRHDYSPYAEKNIQQTFHQNPNNVMSQTANITYFKNTT